MFKDLKNKIDYIHHRIQFLSGINDRFDKLSINIEQDLKELEKRQEDINHIIEEKTQGFPWVARIIADYFYIKSEKVSNYLMIKKHPALKSAEVVREQAKLRRMTEKKYRITKYLLEYYESLFPWLVDFRGEDLDDLIKSYIEKPKIEEEPDDPVRKWITKAEYEKLSTTERNQLALDRYWKKKKRKWEIGRDYERYVGYLYEKDGYRVYYQGIIEGLEDLGRDLVATKDKSAVVIQCKNWSQEKTIHEKHICQFKGTVLKYIIENKHEEVVGRFITSTKLSNVARNFAKALDIEVKENFPFQIYPSIKCNVSRRTNEKIYHLLFDQQYDRTLIEEERNECYVQTVAEAEKLGFRRAWRWRGDKEE